jgi:hypothetical protein
MDRSIIAYKMGGNLLIVMGDLDDLFLSIRPRIVPRAVSPRFYCVGGKGFSDSNLDFLREALAACKPIGLPMTTNGGQDGNAAGTTSSTSIHVRLWSINQRFH